MKKTATAIALATLMVAMSLSLSPAAVASQTNCGGEDFTLATSESSAIVRDLDPNEKTVGVTDVQADDPQDLFIDLHDEPRMLEWEVWTENTLGQCFLYASDDIDDMSDNGDPRVTLADPDLGSQEYWIHYANDGTQSFDFKTWVEV